MKENQFKDILTNGEEAFQAQAWSDLSRKLDQKMPVKKNPFSSPLSKIILTSSVLFVGSGIYLLTNRTQDANAKISKKTSEQTAPLAETKAQDQQANNDSKTINSTSVSTSETQTQDLQSAKTDHQSDFQSKTEDLTDGVSNELTTTHKKEEIEHPIETQKQDFITPIVNEFYCFGEKISIQNKNKYAIDLVDPNGKAQVLKAGQTTEITLNHSGNYTFNYPEAVRKNNGNSLPSQAFVVANKTELDINYIADVDYENGLPYVQISSNDFSENATWSSNKGQILEQAASTKLRTFNKGTYSVTLTKIDENDCKTARTVQIELRDEKDEYNLLALNTIEPNHADPRINHFMPPALKYRSTPFKLTIIDPKDNHVVFVSTNAENAWDGIDHSTGQQVEAKKLFIWTVNITNPEPGERSDYGGTLIRL